MNIVKPQSAAHWYSQNPDRIWQPCYEVPKKDGKGMKKVTLREAREFNLFPSVTGVLSILNKPGLEAWKQEQAILAALTLPRLPDESLDDFVKRVVLDMDSESLTARNIGGDIHTGIKNWFAGEPVAPEVQPYLKSVIEWATQEIEQNFGSEIVVGDRELGVAGRLDLHAVLRTYGNSVVDWKTQKINKDKSGKKQPEFYIEWPRQLAAYARCVPYKPELAFPSLISVVIDSSEPGPVYVKQWDDYEKHIRQFKYCVELWCEDRQYCPKP